MCDRKWNCGYDKANEGAGRKAEGPNEKLKEV